MSEPGPFVIGEYVNAELVVLRARLAAVELVAESRRKAVRDLRGALQGRVDHGIHHDRWCADCSICQADQALLKATENLAQRSDPSQPGDAADQLLAHLKAQRERIVALELKLDAVAASSARARRAVAIARAPYVFGMG